jgi:hypothetical protein
VCDISKNCHDEHSEEDDVAVKDKNHIEGAGVEINIGKFLDPFPPQP